MKFLAILGIVIFVLSCYWCGVVGTWDFIQTIPTHEKNGWVKKCPVRICFFFPVLVPVFCVVPYGYGEYYRACCLMQTRNWITIGVWVISSVLTALSGQLEILIVAAWLYVLKWITVTKEMEAVIQSTCHPICTKMGVPPLQYVVERRQSEYSGAYLSLFDWIDLCAFALAVAINCYICPELCYFYLPPPVFAILFWLIVFWKNKQLLAGERFRVFGKPFLALLNVILTAVYYVCFMLSIMFFDLNFWLAVILSPMIYCRSFNKVTGYSISRCIR